MKNLWQLEVRPERLEEVARTRRAQGSTLTGASDDLISATGKVCGQSWQGIAANKADKVRTDVTGSLDELARSAGGVADVLERVAASQRASKGYLLDSLQRITAAGVTPQVTGDQITFRPADAQAELVVRREIAEARDIRAALDKTLAAAAKELRALNTALCLSAAKAASTAEEARLVRHGKLISKIINDGGLRRNVTDFEKALAAAKSPQEVEALVKRHGEALWAAAAQRARKGLNDGRAALTDDRPLYWARLEMEAALRRLSPGFELDAAKRDELIRSLDESARGMTTHRFTPGVKRVFISGFDPFELESNLGGVPQRGNNSGAAALALDGTTIEVDTPGGKEKYEIQSVMMPVRHREFGDGIVGRVFGEVMRDPNPPKAVITFSLGTGSSNFELEKYYGNDYGNHPDNNNVTRPGQIPGTAPDPFLESTLPTDRMEKAKITTAGVKILPDPSRDLVTGTGSGGDYFSNALPRLVAEQREQFAPGVQTGHVHIPDVGADAGKRLSVIKDIKALIKAAVTP